MKSSDDRVGSPVLFSGHLLTAGDAAPDALEAAERSIARNIGSWLDKHRISEAFSALACGSDIIFAERAIERDIPFHVVLPVTVPRFADLSVAIGNGACIRTNWVERYHSCLGNAASVLELWSADVPDEELDFHFRNCNRHMVGETILSAIRAAQPPLMLAVMHADAPATIAGTRGALSEYEALGLRADVIASLILRAPKSGAGNPLRQDPFSPIVLAISADSQAGARAPEFLAHQGFEPAPADTGNVAAFHYAEDFSQALNAAASAAAKADEAGMQLQFVCDFGPVSCANGPTGLDRLNGASGWIGEALPGDIVASRAFVMQHLARGGRVERYAVHMPAGEQLEPFQARRSLFRVANGEGRPDD
ncbi:MAG: hypothetical protein WDZ83_07520 [Rhizobiaceae bacterium]